MSNEDLDTNFTVSITEDMGSETNLLANDTQDFVSNETLDTKLIVSELEEGATETSLPADNTQDFVSKEALDKIKTLIKEAIDLQQQESYDLQQQESHIATYVPEPPKRTSILSDLRLILKKICCLA